MCPPGPGAARRQHRLPPDARAALLTFLRTLFPELSQHSASATYYVTQATGDDARPCDQARSQATPRRSINAGFACLAPGDTLHVGPGTYDELLQGQASASRECGSSDTAAQPGCTRLPNGLDAQRPTRLLGDGTAIISPAGRQWPGGGLVMNLYDYSRYLHIEGLRFLMSTVPGSTGGLLFNNAQYITVTRNEFHGGPGGGVLKSGLTSQVARHYAQQRAPRRARGRKLYRGGGELPLSACDVSVRPGPRD